MLKLFFLTLQRLKRFLNLEAPHKAKSKLRECSHNLINAFIFSPLIQLDNARFILKSRKPYQTFRDLFFHCSITQIINL